MIVITGAAGSIGSVFLAFLNEKNVRDAVLIDDFAQPAQYNNLAWKHYSEIVSTDRMEAYLSEHKSEIDAIVHLDSREGSSLEDQVEWIQKDKETHQFLWGFCSQNEIPLIFTSTAEVYSNSTIGSMDDIETSLNLKPDHPYIKAKLALDNWSLRQESQPPFWAALRLAYVYGPNEYHKKEQSSIVLKGYEQILEHQYMSLQSSEIDEVLKDYIYVRDVAEVILFLIAHHPELGIYNVGSGNSISAQEVGDVIFDTLNIEPKYEFDALEESDKKEIPKSISVDITKLRTAGYIKEMTSVAVGVKEYVNSYLKRGEFY